MGVMQVARPLKPQDSRCVTYLADANSKEKFCDAEVFDGEVSQEKVAQAIFASEKTYRDLSESAAFSEDSTSFAKHRLRRECKKQEVTVDLTPHIVDSNDSGTAAHDIENTGCGGEHLNSSTNLEQNTCEDIDNSITKRVDELLKSYRDGKTTVLDERHIKQEVSGLGPQDLKRLEIISNDIEGEIVRCCKKGRDHSYWNETEMKRVTRKKAPEMKVQTCGRGRPRKKSLGKRGGNSCDKQSSQDGSENGEGRPSRGRQQRNGGQSNGGGGGGGGRRRRDDDDREDDNDDIEDDFDENNEDDDEEEDEQTGTESVADETELTPEQEAEMAQVSLLDFLTLSSTLSYVMHYI